MFKNISIIAIIIMAWWLPSSGQTDPGQATLDSLITRALTANPRLLAQEDASRAAHYNSSAAGWLPDPTVSVGLMNVPYDSWATDESPMSSLALGITQKIPWPGKLANQKGVANLGAKTGDLMVRMSRNKVIDDLQSAYYDYSYYALAENIIDDNLTLLQSLVEVAQTKYANGEGTAADVLQAQTELSVTQNKRLELERMRRQAAGNINTLLDQAPNSRDSYPVYLPATLPDSLSASELLADVKANNPALAISNTQVDIATKQKALAKSDYWPELMLNFQYQIKDKIPMVAGSGKDFISANVGLSLPLWFYHNQNNNLKAAKSRVRMARNSYAAYQRDLENRLYDKVLELNRLSESFQLYDRTIITQAQATLESANIAYQVGKVDFLKLIDAERSLYAIQLDRLAILRDYHKNYAALEELIGASEERYQQ